MPDGITIRGKGAKTVGQQTKNAMVILDPQTWKAVQIFKMHEKDGLERTSTPHVGYEDMRLFKTDKGGLQGIAASLHLKRDQHRSADGKPQHQPPEQVLLSFDESYNIVSAQPIRGAGFSGTPQKNWVPFDHCAEPRFLYSIDKGTMFDDRGAVNGDEARARPSTVAKVVPPFVALRSEASPKALPTSLLQEEQAPTFEDTWAKQSERRTPIRGGDSRIVRGGRIKLDTMTSRPSARPSHSSVRPGMLRGSHDSTRAMGTGRVHAPTYGGLRGGTQLVHIGADAWLGIGHEMKFVSGKKYYWHTWYVVNGHGKMTAAGPPCKLAPEGIEFAAGMAIDGDRVVVSFGVDDMACRIGETSLSAVLATLVPRDVR